MDVQLRSQVRLENLGADWCKHLKLGEQQRQSGDCISSTEAFSSRGPHKGVGDIAALTAGATVTTNEAHWRRTVHICVAWGVTGREGRGRIIVADLTGRCVVSTGTSKGVGNSKFIE